MADVPSELSWGSVASGAPDAGRAGLARGAALARLAHVRLEDMGARRSARGGFAANGSREGEAARYYAPEAGFPDLTAFSRRLPDGSVVYPHVATYSGVIINRELAPGEKIFRVFGPEGSTHGTRVEMSLPVGAPSEQPSFWGLNRIPTSAESWRQGWAVLDEWNRTGFIVIGTVLDGHALRACTGVIAEQTGTRISQYLRGGARQAMLAIPSHVGAMLNAIGERVTETCAAEVVEAGGVRWEFRATGWTDANGRHGYR
jgi:hypothetical protein